MPAAAAGGNGRVFQSTGRVPSRLEAFKSLTGMRKEDRPGRGITG